MIKIVLGKTAQAKNVHVFAFPMNLIGLEYKFHLLGYLQTTNIEHTPILYSIELHQLQTTLM